jgi:hypothetical protein
MSAEMSRSSLPTWEQDIKPMFREWDREEMLYQFDLWSYQEVRDNAEGIYDRVAAGSPK